VCVCVCVCVCLCVCLFVCVCVWRHGTLRSVAKTHRIPYLYRSFSAKVTYIWWLFCGKPYKACSVVISWLIWGHLMTHDDTYKLTHQINWNQLIWWLIRDYFVTHMRGFDYSYEVISWLIWGHLMTNDDMMTHTGWRRLVGCLKLQVIFRKRATKYATLLRKMTYKHRPSYGSSPPCMSWLIKSTEINGFDDSYEIISWLIWDYFVTHMRLFRDTYEIISWLIGGDLITHVRWFHRSVPAHEHSNDWHMCTRSPWHLSHSIQHTATHCNTL